MSLRKLVNFARRERPTAASEMTRCLDAGTGCGWCIPFLEKIVGDPEASMADMDLSADEYGRRRRSYIESGQPKNTF